jgi:hypothetical protein
MKLEDKKVRGILMKPKNQAQKLFNLKRIIEILKLKKVGLIFLFNFYLILFRIFHKNTLMNFLFMKVLLNLLLILCWK